MTSGSVARSRLSTASDASGAIAWAGNIPSSEWLLGGEAISGTDKALEISDCLLFTLTPDLMVAHCAKEEQRRGGSALKGRDMERH